MNLRTFAIIAWLCAAILFEGGKARGFDYEGHRTVNQLALTSLPPAFPSFVRETAARERIVFLSGEADRWRNVSDLPLRHVNGPDHYIDLEELPRYGLTPDTLTLLRYDFVANLARERAAHPDRFPSIDPGANQDHTRELPGFLPWAIVENLGKLKSAFSYLKAYQVAGGTPVEIANAQADVIYVMGVMGHFVGDAAQPLHTSIHHHGWVGANPRGYTTDRAFHQWIDGDYFRRTGGLKPEAMAGAIHTAQRRGDRGRPDAVFRAVLAYIVEQHQQLETLYQLEKDGKLSGEGDKGLQGRAFLEGQLIRAGQMLGDLWFTAWEDAPVDNFLQNQLAARAAAAEKR